MFDANQDGRISRHELQSLFAEKSLINSEHSSELMLQEIMREVDKDNDDHISYEEFNDALTSLLKRAV